MHLQQHGRPLVREAFEHVELPQGLGRVEGTRQHASHRSFQLEAAPRRRDRRAPQMEIEVEMIVVDPQRPREITRHTEHPLSQAGREVQSRFHDALHVVVGQRTVRREGRAWRCPRRACASTDAPGTGSWRRGWRGVRAACHRAYRRGLAGGEGVLGCGAMPHRRHIALVFAGALAALALSPPARPRRGLRRHGPRDRQRLRTRGRPRRTRPVRRVDDGRAQRPHGGGRRRFLVLGQPRARRRVLEDVR